MSTVTEWKKLPLSLAELCIETTLRCGQAFRWHKIDDAWHCALDGRVVSLKQDPEHLHYRATFPRRPAPTADRPKLSTRPTCGPPADDDEDDTLALLHEYFSLSHSLAALYAQWSATDANFAARARAFGGVRMLNQDAWETLVAFICSSNNNIARIGGMVGNLCANYGPLVGTVDGQPFHDFPTPEVLASAPDVEARLRALGFGYRAKYVFDTAKAVATARPPGWLAGLRNPASRALLAGRTVKVEVDTAADEEERLTYEAAHKALLGLAGVGQKVADCVCLMGLGWGEAVPVDTHVWQIARRDYKFSAGAAGNPKTLTKNMYDAVGHHFRTIWGPQAGWAQSVLFTANLKSFSEQAAGTKKAEMGFSDKANGAPGRQGQKRSLSATLDTGSNSLSDEDENKAASMKGQGEKNKAASTRSQGWKKARVSKPGMATGINSKDLAAHARKVELGEDVARPLETACTSSGKLRSATKEAVTTKEQASRTPYMGVRWGARFRSSAAMQRSQLANK